MKDSAILSGNDFSVVVQGPIHSSPGRKGERDITIACLASIRRFLPGAEIILSTWKGSPTDGLDFDQLVVSEDPGGTAYNVGGTFPGMNNINRQIVSSREGLAVARRPYAIKFRGDLAFQSAGILQCGGELAAPSGARPSRILISPVITYSSRRSPYLFHFSDIAQAGRTEILRKFWSLPLAPEPETTHWLDRPGAPFSLPVVAHACPLRVSVEQYLTLGWLAQFEPAPYFDSPWDVTPAKALLSEKTLLTYFRIFDLDQLGIRYPERLLASPKPSLYYHQGDWEKLSRAYAKTPTRWIAQAGLLFHLYRNYGEAYLKYYLTTAPIQKFPPYRGLRHLYRLIFPSS